MLKVLHISFHKGCQNDIEYIAKKLNFELTFMEYDDDISIGLDKYNVTHEKATSSWNKHKDYYNSFDIIITSDTAPISRIFLQNNFEKKLIIWICNRFDYANQPAINFPDKEYYDLINDAKNRPNVHIIGYTPFENYYANVIRKLSIGNECIKPIGKIGDVYNNYVSTQVEDKENTFIIGPYHNDNLMMDLKSKVISLGIKVYNGRYDGPKDLAEFAGVIHIPYAWSNLALLEAIQSEIIFFIPSLKFLKYFIHTNIDGEKKDSFFWSPPLEEDVLYLSEWYCEDFKDALIYFDSWDDLKYKINTVNFNNHKELLKKIGDKHENNILDKWKKILCYYNNMKDIYDFLQLQNDNFNIIECGGHLGNDTLKLANIFKNGVIYCIEANIKLYNELIKNINNNIKIFNYYLSDKSGYSEFYIDSNSDGDSGASSILESTDNYLKNYIKKEDKIIIQSITLEDFMKSNNLDKVDLLWLDVEGFEYYILNNAVNILKNIKYIYTEVNLQEFRKNGKLYDDIKSLLVNNNFIEIYKWEQGAEWGHWQGNVLFKNNNFN